MKRFRNILCIVEPEKSLDTAIAQALRFSENHQANITFLSVIKPVRRWQKIFQDNESANPDRAIEDNKRAVITSAIHSQQPHLKAEVLVKSGIPFIEIIRQVVRNDHDLVVKCSEDPDWIERMLGSEDMHLLRKCPCPVLMLKPGDRGEFRHILAAVDVNDSENTPDEQRVQETLNQQVLDYSASISLHDLSELHIGSAWEAFAEDFIRHGGFSSTPEDVVDRYVEQSRRECTARLQTLQKNMAEALGKTGAQFLQPRSHLVMGKASKEIPTLTKDQHIDLIVMGTVGRTGIAGFIIGNTAESILEQTQCSILAIKPQGFKTPVE